MQIGYLECFAGISGDMLLGALVHAGVPETLLRDAVASLGLGAELEFTEVDRSGIHALKARVLVNGREADAPAAGDLHSPAHTKTAASHEHSHSHTHNHDSAHAHEQHSHEHGDPHGHEHSHRPEHRHAHGRTLPAIRAIIAKAGITPHARELALTAFELLGRAEAKIHGMPLESVHFHEIGAVDAIVDIVCACVGLDALAVSEWRCSPVNVGGGFVDCAHGRFPVPAPATAELLKGIPTYSSGIEAELVTPTGAALLRALGCTFGSTAVFAAQSIGYGAGSRNPAKFPNVLRLSLGEEHAGAPGPGAEAEKETITVLECAIDDLSPQLIAYAAEQALSSGALDAMRVPVTMKKGRIGTLLTVLCREQDARRMQELLFRETSTLGIRVRREERVVLARTSVESSTPYGPVRVKTGSLGGAIVNAAPEYEDCRARAEAHHVPLKHVVEAALVNWQTQQKTPEPPAHS